MYFAKSAGCVPRGSMPCDASFSTTSFGDTALATSSRSFCTMAGGVPGGASRPYQPVISYFRPASWTVATSGSIGERLAPVTAIGVTLPSLACADIIGMASNITSMWPPSRSLSAGAEPLYGTMLMLMPVWP